MKGGQMTKLYSKPSTEENDSDNDGNTNDDNGAKDYLTSLNSYKIIA